MSKASRSPFPNWSDSPPEPGTLRSIFKWGDPGTFKHPNKGLFTLMKERLGMRDDDFRERRLEGREKVVLDRPITLAERHIVALKRIVGAKNVADDDYSRVFYTHGKTMEEAMELRRGVIREVADLVVHPRDKEDVARIVAYCNEQKIPLTVHGGGSSVNLGLRPERGGITLALGTHMNKILAVNELNQTVRVQAGMLGPAYEHGLNNAPELFACKRRFTAGHFPQSFEYSSVGGWVVTLGSGQQSSYYGDAYDLVVSQEYVTPRGTIRTKNYAATATGPKVNDIFKGSEGTFGVLVELEMKIFRLLPDSSQSFAFIFPNWEAAVDASREISQGEFGFPSVFRISDPEETDVAMSLYGIAHTPIDSLVSLRGLRPGQRCLFIGQADGERDFARNIKSKVESISKARGGMYISGYPVTKWRHSRYLDPYLREDLQDYGVIIDTLETAVNWDNLHAVHQGVRSFVKSRPNTVCMTHASHFYPRGTNLYFIYIIRVDDVGEYREFQKGIIDSIVQHGGSLSHHHGVGRMIAPWMEEHLGHEEMEVLRTLKRHFDPNNIMNPGAQLGLSLPPEGGKKAPRR